MDPSVLFRSSGQRDDRRRLLLCEPSLSAQVAAPRRRLRRKRPQSLSPHYGDGAFMEHIPKLTDLIPRSLWPYGLVLLVGLVIIAGLEWLYAGLMPQLAPWTADGTVESFDLKAEGSLAVWFSSTSLLLAAGVSVIVYLVRRYRRDDYQGRYRIWLWAAGCWLLMSVDESASLHEGFKEMMVLLTGQRLGGDGSLWWAAAYFFLLAGVGIRLLADMRECLLSCAGLIGAAVCYATAVAVRLEWLSAPSAMQGVMIEEGGEMLGDWLLLVAMALHARHVILEAEGRRAQTDPAHSALFAEASASDGLASGQLSGGGISGGSSAGGTLTPAHSSSVGTPYRGASSASLGPNPSASSASFTAGAAWENIAASGSNAAPNISAGAGSASPGSGLPGPTPTSQVSSPNPSLWSSPPRRLTEAEKKALRRKLEKLRKQRENQTQNS